MCGKGELVRRVCGRSAVFLGGAPWRVCVCVCVCVRARARVRSCTSLSSVVGGGVLAQRGGDPRLHRVQAPGWGCSAHPSPGAQRARRISQCHSGSARRSYPLHFRLNRARPHWLPEGSIHQGVEGKDGGWTGAWGLARGGRGWREPEAPSDTRERQHQDNLGEWGFSGFAFPRGGRGCSLGLGGDEGQ